MSNPDKPRSTRSRSQSLSASPPRQKLQSRRNSSTGASYAPRRTQAERSETTRTQLIEAAIKLVRANGLSGLRTVEVAELAGVSRGALMHHFKSKHDLVVAVIRHVNEISRIESARRATLAKRADKDPIKGIIEDAHDFYFGDYFFIELAIAMSADAESRVLKRETFQTSRTSRFSVEAAWIEALVATGIPEQVAENVLALTLSVVRGFSVRMLLQRDPEQFSHLLKLWHSILRHYLDSELAPSSKKRGS